MWDLESGALKATLKGHTDWVSSVAVTPDGRQIVSGSKDCTMRWVGTGLGSMAGSWVDAAELALTRSGSHARSVWDLESGRCIRQLGLTEVEQKAKTKAEKQGR